MSLVMFQWRERRGKEMGRGRGGEVGFQPFCLDVFLEGGKRI